MAKKKSVKKSEISSGEAERNFGLVNYTHPDQFGIWLGYKVTKVDRKNFRAQARLKVRNDHLSPAGRVHGGVISAFFDYACGAAVFSTLAPEDFCSTVELKVNYFKPIDLGDELLVETKVVFRGKKLCVVHGMLHRKGEKAAAAMATATFNVVSGKSTS